VELGACMGAVLGATQYIMLKTDPALLPPDVVTNHVPLKGFLKSAMRKGVGLAIIGGVYQGTESFLDSSIGKSRWNTAIGGCAAGFALGLRTGSSRNAVVGCVALSAFAPFFQLVSEGSESDDSRVAKRYEEEARELRERINAAHNNTNTNNGH